MIQPLLREDEKLGQLAWSELQTVAMPLIESGSTLVLACGFEDRSFAYLKKSLENGSQGFGVVAIEYRPHYDENQRASIEQLCTTANLKVTPFTYDRCNPAGSGDEIAASLPMDGRIYVDVSGMSRLLLVQLLIALGKRSCGYKNVTVLYTEALEYPPSKEEFESDFKKCMDETGDPEPAFISWGVQAVAILPELTTPAMQGSTTRLIAFPSFNRAQLRQAIDELQPMRIDLINGVPPHNELAWRTEAINRWNARIFESIPNRTEHATSTLDYRDTLRLLLDIYDEYSVYDRLVISPTGSKMQTIAVSIAAAFIADYQIVYPTPMMFSHPERHTIGVKQYYCLALDIFSK